MDAGADFNDAGAERALQPVDDPEFEYQVRRRLSSNAGSWASAARPGAGMPNGVALSRRGWRRRQGRKRCSVSLTLIWPARLIAEAQILDAVHRAGAAQSQHGATENKAIKNGEVAEEWADKPLSVAKKDVRCTLDRKMHGKSHYGYKNSRECDRSTSWCGLARQRCLPQHDSQAVDHLLCRANTGGVGGRNAPMPLRREWRRKRVPRN